MPHWEVQKEDTGLKLIDFLKKNLSDISLKKIKTSIDRSQCCINGQVVRFASTLVGYGDRVSFALSDVKPKPQRESDRILYEDKDFLIYNKPPGISSEDLEKLLQLKLVHRLDLETTGAIILATSQKAKDAMVEEFKQKSVEKSYFALVDGIPVKDHGVIDNYLGKIKTWQGQSLWGSVDKAHGLHAVTEWKLLKKGNKCSLLECRPLTGRTHQIRSHLASFGHPILGEGQYASNFKCPYKAPRCLLHAEGLKFIHPFLKRDTIVKAPLPKDFQEALQILIGPL